MAKRIFDISKELGLHPKVVLAKARELGIAQAKVVSSLLDDNDTATLEGELLTAKKPTQLPQFILQLGTDENNPAIRIGKLVWQEKENFIRWPKRSYLFWPNLKRAAGIGRSICYEYSESQLEIIRAAGLTPRAWTNDPAIFAYKLAGGERPKRTDGNWEWNIHHIYDGRFPAFQNGRTIHAVQNLNYFTEAAGLVAVHPVADALATEVPYFAWLLRHEAFLRFGFDPDQVFGNSK